MSWWRCTSQPPFLNLCRTEGGGRGGQQGSPAQVCCPHPWAKPSRLQDATAHIILCGVHKHLSSSHEKQAWPGPQTGVMSRALPTHMGTPMWPKPTDYDKVAFETSGEKEPETQKGAEAVLPHLLTLCAQAQTRSSKLPPAPSTPRLSLARSCLYLRHLIPILNASKCHYTFL